VRATTFQYTGHDVTVAIEPRHGVEALYAPRRMLLDRTLVDAAAAAGAEFRFGMRVDDVVFDERARVRGVLASGGPTVARMTAEVVVGADGLHSTIAGRVGARSIVHGQHAAGVLYSYWEGLGSNAYEWHFAPGSSVGVIPTNGGATCVFAAVPSDRFREELRGGAESAYRAILARTSAAIAATLSDARRVEPVRGFAGQRGFIKRASGPGWALVGDAGYFKDPLTAHGITDALRDGELLARAILRGDAAALAEYDADRVRLCRGLFDVTDQIASFAWTDAQLEAMHRTFSREMSAEMKVITNLEPLPCLSPLASAPREV
jgi:flavin-dependent dehydrogenase